MSFTPTKILLIEDEESLSKVIALNLQLEGFKVDTIFNGKEAIQHASKISQYDLIILDVMLPEVSGWDICKNYKMVSDVPILFISAKGTSLDKIKGLKLGADDYLAKPFDLEELLLRVRILIQRGQKSTAQKTLLEIGDFEVDTLTYEVRKGDEKIAELSKREIELLQLFDQHENEVVSRDFILEKLWEKDAYPTRTIDNYILLYRKLFEEDSKHPKYFHSVRGVGYKFTNWESIES